jgi:pimeloyl-ACP methyl ester carboxylesterase
MPTVADRHLTASQQRVFDAMVELLARADLEYRGAFVDASRYRIHYLDYGSGPAVMLIHGGGAGGAVWFRQIAALSRRFRVIVPDNPIFGLSTQPDSASPMSEFTTDYLGSFMDVLGIDKASLVGLSVGGYLAARFTVDFPERVARLALINSAGLGRQLPWGFRLSSLPLFGHIFTQPPRWAHDRFFALSEVTHPDARDNDAYLDYAYSVMENEGHSLAVRRNMPVFADMRGQRNVIADDELRSIRQESLVLWGRQDRFFPLSHALRAVSLIPNGRLEILEDCGHIALLDQPGRVSELLSEFLLGSSGSELVTNANSG